MGADRSLRADRVAAVKAADPEEFPALAQIFHIGHIVTLAFFAGVLYNEEALEL